MRFMVVSPLFVCEVNQDYSGLLSGGSKGETGSVLYKTVNSDPMQIIETLDNLWQAIFNWLYRVVIMMSGFDF